MADLLIKADVIIADVDKMLFRLDEGLTGPVLAGFLAGPVQHFFGDEAAYRFGAEGDRSSGDWQELSDATVALRQKMGFSPDDINMRTGDLYEFVTEHYEVRSGPGFAEIDMPGQASGELERKVETAQFGRVDNPIPNFGPTPARPVIATDTEKDAEEVVVMLAEHVIRWMTGIGIP